MPISVSISNSLFEDNDEEFFKCIGNDEDIKQPLKSKKMNNKLIQTMNKYRRPNNIPNDQTNII